MIEMIFENLATQGVLGSMCIFLIWKDIKKDNKIIETLNKMSIIIDERLPKM